MDTYYDDTNRQHWGLWRYEDEAWEPRPGFYAWSLITRYTRPGSRVVQVQSDPPAPSLRSVALISPKGELTVLMVNRYARPMTVNLDFGLGGSSAFRVYRYSREAIPTPDRGMIGPSEVLCGEPDSATRLRLEPESFALLTGVQ